MPKQRVLPMPVSQGKKSFKRAVLDSLAKTQKQVIGIKRDMREEIEKQMEERHGDFIHQIQSALDGVIAMKEMFIAKGLFTREEYNAQKAKMRKKNG